MAIDNQVFDEAPAATTTPLQYGERIFTDAEIEAWKKVAEDADQFWYLRGSDSALDEEFFQKFNVTFFQHAHLSRHFGRWGKQHGIERHRGHP